VEARVKLLRGELERERDTVAAQPSAQVASPAAAASTIEPGPIQAPEERSDGKKPLLSKWWFWTLAGVVLAGGVATALETVLVERRPSGSSPQRVLLRGRVQSHALGLRSSLRSRPSRA
jgi:hypothetical protein